MTAETLTLVYELEAYEALPSHKHDRKSKFKIYLNDNLIGIVASPITDGARLLLKMGYDPDTLLTTRSVDSRHASWVPQPLHHWAKTTVRERDGGGLIVEAFKPFQGVAPTAASQPLAMPTYPEAEKGLPVASVEACEAVA